jgi:hypothetical protein
VTLVAAEASEDEPAIGLLTVVFGAAADTTTYQVSSASQFEFDAAGGLATVVDEQATGFLPDGSTDVGPIFAAVACAQGAP